MTGLTRKLEFFSKTPEVVQTDGLTLKWTAPDEEAVVAFLCGEKSFNEDKDQKAACRSQEGKKPGRPEPFGDVFRRRYREVVYGWQAKGTGKRQRQIWGSWRKEKQGGYEEKILNRWTGT